MGISRITISHLNPLWSNLIKETPRSKVLAFYILMIDGRHCTEKDLDVLVKETSKVKLSIAKNGDIKEKNAELQRFLAFLRRFDVQIADSLKTQIESSNNDYGLISQLIDRSVDELKQNVLVDIYEHQ